VVKVTMNLIVYPELGSDEKLKLTTKLDVKPYSFSDLFKNYVIKMFENQINFKKVFKMTLDTTIKHFNFKRYSITN
jgi:hypothetical protein